MQVKDLETLKSFINKPLPPSPWVQVTQEMIQSFANTTQDQQWIHTDVERAARESPFHKTVAHGFLTLSLLSALMAQTIKVESMKMGINYGFNKIRFIHPVISGSKVRLNIRLLSIADEARGSKLTWEGIVEIEGENKPACVVEWLTVLME